MTFLTASSAASERSALPADVWSATTQQIMTSWKVAAKDADRWPVEPSSDGLFEKSII